MIIKIKKIAKYADVNYGDHIVMMLRKIDNFCMLTIDDIKIYQTENHFYALVNDKKLNELYFGGEIIEYTDNIDIIEEYFDNNELLDLDSDDDYIMNDLIEVFDPVTEHGEYFTMFETFLDDYEYQSDLYQLYQDDGDEIVSYYDRQTKKRIESINRNTQMWNGDFDEWKHENYLVKKYLNDNRARIEEKYLKQYQYCYWYSPKQTDEHNGIEWAKNQMYEVELIPQGVINIMNEYLY